MHCLKAGRVVENNRKPVAVPSFPSPVSNAEDKGSKIQINIKDTGIGIQEKDITHIFERFYRVDKARSRRLGGTGLGLSIVKHLAQAHSGEVLVSSVEGQGSVFSIIFFK